MVIGARKLLRMFFSDASEGYQHFLPVTSYNYLKLTGTQLYTGNILTPALDHTLLNQS